MFDALFVAAVPRNGCVLIASERIQVQQLVGALDRAETSAEAKGSDMGLLGGMARTAVWARTATAVSAAPSATGDDRIEQLKSLADVKAQGVLTDQEFAAEKARIIGR